MDRRSLRLAPLVAAALLIAAPVAAQEPGAAVTYRDLVASPLPHLSGAHLMAANARPEEIDTQTAAEIAESKAVLEEFLAADRIVLGVPLEVHDVVGVVRRRPRAHAWCRCLLPLLLTHHRHQRYRR